MIRTRFAPSPTGPLHLGHAYAAKVAYDYAQAHNGEFLIRVEDLDQSRARPEWETLIFHDMTWLGFSWGAPVVRQSERSELYDDALNRLWDMGVLYPCICKRKDIEAAASAPQEGLSYGPDGLVYPGTCRQSPLPRIRPKNTAIRLNTAKAFDTIGQKGTSFCDLIFGTDSITKDEFCTSIGDPILQRRDMAAAYHLAVVVDDAEQDITHVSRGNDLREATFIHRLLQSLLDLPEPMYLHHHLVRDAAGKRLAKRDDAKAIRAYREQGLSVQDIFAMLPTN